MRSSWQVAATVVACLVGTAASGWGQDAQARMWDAAIAGDTAAIGAALAAGARIDSLDTRRSANGRRALNWAALNNRANAIRFLVARGAPVEAENRTGFTALHHAAEAGALEAAQALLALGADPTHLNAGGVRPSEIARERGFTAVADALEAAERSGPRRPDR